MCTGIDHWNGTVQKIAQLYQPPTETDLAKVPSYYHQLWLTVSLSASGGLWDTESW